MIPVRGPGLDGGSSHETFKNICLSDYLSTCPFFLSLALETFFFWTLTRTPKTQWAKCSGRAHEGELRTCPPYCFSSFLCFPPGHYLDGYQSKLSLGDDLENVLRMTEHEDWRRLLELWGHGVTTPSLNGSSPELPCVRGTKQNATKPLNTLFQFLFSVKLCLRYLGFQMVWERVKIRRYRSQVTSQRKELEPHAWFRSWLCHHWLPDTILSWLLTSPIGRGGDGGLTAEPGKSRERQQETMEGHEKQEIWRELHGDEIEGFA